MKKDEKVFRDPIYNLISFSKEEEAILIKLIDTEEVQRLKRIRQLGVTSVTYSSALHDRFTHSLGTSYLAALIYDGLNTPNSVVVDGVSLSREEFRLLIRMGALLHDIGHGPYSHAFEAVSGVSHEDISCRLIENEEGSIKPITMDFPNKEARTYVAKWLSALIKKEFPIRWAQDIISSQIDADRIDYLLRDAYMCGVEYTRFDWRWLINSMKINTTAYGESSIVFDAQKGLSSLESFITSRYHMYEQVYLHKTSRGAEVLLAKLLGRCAYLVKNGLSSIYLDEPLKRFLLSSRDSFSLSDFLILDDFYISHHIRLWARDCSDSLLKDLCICFSSRKLYKAFYLKNCEEPFATRKKDIIDFFNGDYDYFYFVDDAINTPYKDDYLLGEDERGGNIWVTGRFGDIKPLAEVSPIIGSLRNSLKKLHREYVHRDYYHKLKEKLEK